MVDGSIGSLSDAIGLLIRPNTGSSFWGMTVGAVASARAVVKLHLRQQRIACWSVPVPPWPLRRIAADP
jgi:hypothetical protein